MVITGIRPVHSDPGLTSPRLQASWMPRIAFSPPASGPRGDTLLVIFLRGAADGLNILVPHAEEAYYRLRPTLGIPRPDDLRQPPAARTINLDGFFGLHPAFRPLLPAWQSNHLAFIHACGAPDESRSHFKSMELMERGVEDERGPASGWIGRHLASLNSSPSSPLRAVGVGNFPQRSLTGQVPVSSLRSIADFHFNGDPRSQAQMTTLLNRLYSGNEPLSTAGQDTLQVMAALEKLDPLQYPSAEQPAYPDSDFGLGLRQVALLIHAQVGLEAAAIDLGGWDTHFAQGASGGQMATLLGDLALGIAALVADLWDHLNHLSVVVMTEFGRRAGENGSLGTDHGHGGLMMVLGGNVIGGKVHGTWPGLEPDQLMGPGDLAVTSDYRDVLGEICTKRLNNSALEIIFPGHRCQPLGLLRAG